MLEPRAKKNRVKQNLVSNRPPPCAPARESQAAAGESSSAVVPPVFA